LLTFSFLTFFDERKKRKERGAAHRV